MSWLFSQALVEEYWGENSLDGEQSVQSSGSHTQLAYLPPDRMTDFSRVSRYGMTFKPLTADLGEALLMSFREAFRARTSPQQEKEQESTESGQECGEKWRGWLAKLDPDSCSWKTAQCSLLEEEPESLETLPRSGMTRGGLLWELPMSERRTKETGFGSLPDRERLPTPQSTDYRDKPTSSSWKAKGGVNFSLANPEIRAKWPTPRSCSAMAATITPESAWAENRFPNLETVVGQRMWPTPTAHNAKEGGFPSEHERNTPTLSAQAGGSLNPMWVEWLMGWPLGWTDLKPLEMDKSLSAPQQLGES